MVESAGATERDRFSLNCRTQKKRECFCTFGLTFRTGDGECSTFFICAKAEPLSAVFWIELTPIASFFFADITVRVCSRCTDSAGDAGNHQS